jgi:hypothetical protein
MTKGESPVSALLSPDVESSAGIDVEGEDGQRAWVPGIPTMRAQQRELIDRLRSGFTSRREVFYWAHAVGVLSWGWIRPNWYADLLTDPFMVAALLRSRETREQVAQQPPTDAGAETLRTDMETTVLQPAFQRARQDLVDAAGDFDPSSDTNPSEQRYIAMRPRLHQVALDQHDALSRAFETHDARESVVDWLDALDNAAPGAFPPEFFRRVTTPTSEWWVVLTADTPGVRLEEKLAEEVLPRLNATVARAVETGSESPARRSSGKNWAGG